MRQTGETRRRSCETDLKRAGGGNIMKGKRGRVKKIEREKCSSGERKVERENHGGTSKRVHTSKPADSDLSSLTKTREEAQSRRMKHQRNFKIQLEPV